MHSFTFSKSERLTSRTQIERLFLTGKRLHYQSFKIYYLKTLSLNATYPVQIVISVPKRLFKKAVDRNKIKRLMREAFRHHKEILYKPLNEKNLQFSIMLIYQGKSIPNYQEVYSKIKILFQRFANSIINKESM